MNYKQDNQERHFCSHKGYQQEKWDDVPLANTFPKDAAVMVVPHRAFITPNAMFTAPLLVYFTICTKSAILIVLVLLILEDGSCVQVAQNKEKHYLANKTVVDHWFEEIPHVQITLNHVVNQDIDEGPTYSLGYNRPSIAIFETDVVASIDPQCKIQRTFIEFRRPYGVFNLQLLSFLYGKCSRIIRLGVVFLISHYLNKSKMGLLQLLFKWNLELSPPVRILSSIPSPEKFVKRSPKTRRARRIKLRPEKISWRPSIFCSRILSFKKWIRNIATHSCRHPYMRLSRTIFLQNSLSFRKVISRTIPAACNLPENPYLSAM